METISRYCTRLQPPIDGPAVRSAWVDHYRGTAVRPVSLLDEPGAYPPDAVPPLLAPPDVDEDDESEDDEDDSEVDEGEDRDDDREDDDGGDVGDFSDALASRPLEYPRSLRTMPRVGAPPPVPDDPAVTASSAPPVSVPHW